jgi:hypothetical protein
MGELLLSAGAVAVLVAFGALVAAARPRRGGSGRRPAHPSTPG